MELSGREHVPQDTCVSTDAGREAQACCSSRPDACTPAIELRLRHAVFYQALPAGYNGRRARKGWGRWAQTVGIIEEKRANLLISWKIGRTKQMTLFQPGCLKPAECVARKMGFGTPLCWFLNLQIVFDLGQKIWESNSHGFYLYRAPCFVVIQQPNRASCIFSPSGWRKWGTVSDRVETSARIHWVGIHAVT